MKEGGARPDVLQSGSQPQHASPPTPQGAGQITTAPLAATGRVGLVLAGGIGQRFDPSGARYKLVQPLPDGRPVVRAACEALLPWVDTLVVVCGARQADIAATLDGLAWQAIACPEAARGMGATLKHGVAATPTATSWIVALADMPFLTAGDIGAVARALAAGARVARPRHAGMPGHPVGFSMDCREALLALDDAHGAGPWLRRQVDITWVEGGPGVVRDVDVPADLG